MFGLLRVRDFNGEGWRQLEIESIHIAGDEVAIARFDEAFLDELKRVGIKTPNALANRAGLGYDTAAEIFKEPHKMSRRVFWVVTENVGLQRLKIEGLALGVASTEEFLQEYETAKIQAWLLVDAFLMLDKQSQFMVRRMVEATRPKGGYPQGSREHIEACKQLSEQMQMIVGLHPDREHMEACKQLCEQMDALIALHPEKVNPS